MEDETLDAVYVALPASLHAEWTIAAVEAGRHVLCEKPFASNAAEAREMVAAAERADRRLVEAFHWRFHPVAERVIALAREIGPLVAGEGHFDAVIPPTDIRYVRELGGGATMDLGCYPIHWVRTITGEEPEVVRAEATEGPPGIDVTMEAELAFPSGLLATIRTSMAPGSLPLPEVGLPPSRGSQRHAARAEPDGAAVRPPDPGHAGRRQGGRTRRSTPGRPTSTSCGPSSGWWTARRRR